MKYKLPQIATLFDGPVRDANGRLLIYDNEKLKTWKERLTTILNRIIFDEVSHLVGDMVIHCSMRIRTVLRNGSDLTFAINALKRSHGVFDVLAAELFHVASQVSAELLL